MSEELIEEGTAMLRSTWVVSNFLAYRSRPMEAAVASKSYLEFYFKATHPPQLAFSP
jgi:hypothetical protein